jgi:hypothetical protein
MTKHLTVSEISRLIDGREDTAETDSLWEHLNSCERCSEIYHESVVDCGLSEADRSLRREISELVEEGLAIAVCKKAARSSRKRRSRSSVLLIPASVQRYMATAAAVVLVVAAGIWMLNIDSNIGRQIPGSVLEPLQSAAESISRSGPIIIHGGESAVGEESAVIRAGFVPMTNPIRRSVDYLYSRYENDSATPEEIYWLAAGYVATGQVDLARDLVADARRNGIDDLEILNLEALIAYIGGDLERAEDLFHSIHVLYPSDAVSSINFAVVLRESGKQEDSSRVLGEVMEGFSGTPFAKRAEILQGTD